MVDKSPIVLQGRQNDMNKEYRVARSHGKMIVSPYWLFAVSVSGMDVSVLFTLALCMMTGLGKKIGAMFFILDITGSFVCCNYLLSGDVCLFLSRDVSYVI